MNKPPDRFPELEHLAWARFRLSHAADSLATSQVPPPPADVFDPGGAMPVVVTEKLRGDLIEAVAARYEARADHITLTAGVSEGLYLVSVALLEAGDWVLSETPAYRSLAAVPASVGATVKPLPRTLDGDFETETVRAEIARVAWLARQEGRRLRAVYLSDLHNPTGSRLEDADLAAIAGACESAGAHLVIDEVYRDGDPKRPTGSARQVHPRVIALGSLTKSYGLGGLRAGWVSAPPPVTRRLTRVQNYLSIQPAAPSMLLARRALGSAEKILGWARNLVARNEAKLRTIMSERPGSFTCSFDRRGGTVVFPYRPHGSDTRLEARSWLETHSVEVVPGVYFGAPEGVRIGLGVEPELFSQAVERWAEAASRMPGEDGVPEIPGDQATRSPLR